MAPRTVATRAATRRWRRASPTRMPSLLPLFLHSGADGGRHGSRAALSPRARRPPFFTSGQTGRQGTSRRQSRHCEGPRRSSQNPPPRHASSRRECRQGSHWAMSFPSRTLRRETTRLPVTVRHSVPYWDVHGSHPPPPPSRYSPPWPPWPPAPNPPPEPSPPPPRPIPQTRPTRPILPLPLPRLARRRHSSWTRARPPTESTQPATLHGAGPAESVAAPAAARAGAPDHPGRRRPGGGGGAQHQAPREESHTVRKLRKRVEYN